MKVLLDLQYLNVATTGIKTYMMELANAARRYPHEDIQWIFSHEPEDQAKDATFRFRESKVQRVRYHLDYFRWKEFQLPDLVYKHRPDVLICPDFVSPAVELPCRRLTVFHDAFFWQMPQNYPLWWRKYFLRLIQKGLQDSTHIVTTTQYSKKALVQAIGEKWPISVIYQAPKNLLDPSDAGVLSRHHLEEKAYFLHVGTFDRRKNLPLLVAAFARYLQAGGGSKKLVLAGGHGQSKQLDDYEKVEELVRSHDLVDQVILPGYCSDGEVKALYQGAFAYVFPSENEGFGIPILEAMGFGIPVIHSDQPALEEVSGGAGLSFCSGNEDELVKKMILLEQDTTLVETLKNRGLERAEMFSAKKFIEEFQSLILTKDF